MCKNLTILLLIMCSFSASAELIEAENIESVMVEYRKFRAKYQAHEILTVFDIDNTLLSMKKDFASDPWFDWQVGLLINDPKNKNLVAGTFEELLDVWSKALGTEKMELVEPATLQLVRDIQASGSPSLAITAREFGIVDATERELFRNGIKLSCCDGVSNLDLRNPWKVYDPNTQNLFTGEEVDNFKLIDGRPVSYSNGVFYTSGMHKGAMLRVIMDKLGLNSIKAVIFADDKLKHAQNVEEGMANQNIETATIRYSYLDQKVKSFIESDKAAAITEWKEYSEKLAKKSCKAAL